MSLAEGAMAPSPAMAMTTGLPKPPSPAPTPPMRRSRSMLELAEQVAERAAAPASPLVEQVPAASPAPLLFAYAPGKAPPVAEKAPTLAELYRQDKSMEANIAPSAYEGERERLVFFFFRHLFSLCLTLPSLALKPYSPPLLQRSPRTPSTLI